MREILINKRVYLILIYKMDLFKTLNNIYTNPDLSWLNDLEGNESSFMIQKWLGMNRRIIKYVNFMDKYLYVLTSKQYITMIAILLPKQPRAPFIRYIKNKEEDDLYIPIWDKIRKVLNMSDNDWKYSKKYIIKDVEENKIEYFKSLGINKKLWKKHDLDFEEMKGGEIRKGKKGLDLFC